MSTPAGVSARGGSPNHASGEERGQAGVSGARKPLAGSRWRLYALAGAVLSLGAPLGLFLVQLVRAGSQGLGLVGPELAHDRSIYLYVLLSTLVVFSIFGAVLGRQADRLATLSGEDPITGLPNALRFHERLTQELAFAERYQLPLSLIVIEIEIEVEGLGDRARRQDREAVRSFLRSIAGVLRAGSRAGDVPARLAGSRFAVLAPCTSAAATASLADRLSLLVRGTAGGELVEVQVGVATMGPGTMGTPHALLDAATSALEAGRSPEGVAAHCPVGAPEGSPD